MKIFYDIGFEVDGINFLYVSMNFSEIKLLKQPSPRFGLKKLGVILAPNVNKNDTINGINKKASSWPDKIFTGNIPKS